MSTKSTKSNIILSQLISMQKKNGTNPSYAVNRAGRVYWNNRIPFDSSDMSDHHHHHGSARALEQNNTLSPVASLDNPFVIGAISAGVLGVAIIITIMLGVWIKSKLMSQSGRHHHRRNHKQRSNMNNDGDELDSTTIVSSISTLDASAEDNNPRTPNPNNFSQMDSIRLDDTTLDLSLMEQTQQQQQQLPSMTGDSNANKDCSATESKDIVTTIEVESTPND